MLTVKKHYPHPRIANAAMKRVSVLALLMLFSTLALHAQKKPVRGTVINSFTKEQVPFASIVWKKAGYGTLTDSLGRFSLTSTGATYDTLVVSYVGFSDLLVPIKNTDTATLVLFLSESRRKDS